MSGSASTVVIALGNTYPKVPSISSNAISVYFLKVSDLSISDHVSGRVVSVAQIFRQNKA